MGDRTAVSAWNRANEDKLVPAVSVVGLQWGDEAKGKLVDLLTPGFDFVVRYQGGANAGHTVVVGDQTYKLSLIPSGILTPGVVCVVAGGVVVHPAAVIGEIDGLAARGAELSGRLLLSDRAHVIFPWHIVEDRLFNSAGADSESIGTTLRGIGPCYRDKVGRAFAIRLGDLVRPGLEDRIRKVAEAKQRMIASLDVEAADELNVEEIIKDYKEYAERLRPFIADTTATLHDALDDGKRLLFEGAQGALLDVDHGTFPFVTSSNSSGVGVGGGSGVPSRWFEKSIGVVKAYTTRVGGGPFPTELGNALGQQIRDQGNEYGTVTRRPRRCGWFDAVAARYTARLSGVDRLAVMLLDVLSGLPELHICTAYEIDGERTPHFPSHVDDLRRAVPVYEECTPWTEDITGVRLRENLPAAAQDYLQRIERLVGVDVTWASVGPERTQTIDLPAA